MPTITVRAADNGLTLDGTLTYTITVTRRPMLLGSSHVDSGTALAAYQTRYGPLRIARRFESPGKFPTAWNTTKAAVDVGHRSVAWSFKPYIGDVPAIAAIATGVPAAVAQLRGLLDSIPTDGHRHYLCLWHEPEGEIKKRLFTVAAFHDASARFGQLVRDTGRDDLTAMVIFGGTQCFDGLTEREFGFAADDLAPAGMMAGFDAYNLHDGGADTYPWRDLSYRMRLQVEWAKASGRRFAITETGCHEYRTGTDADGDPLYDPARKVAWTLTGLAWAEAQGAEFVAWFDGAFDSDTDKIARRLHSSPQHVAAWRTQNTAGTT
jgi:hypothetical protein